MAQLCLTLCDPWTIAAQAPGKNTGGGYHSLLQGIFLIQGSSLGFLHCRLILYCLSHLGSPVYNIIIIPILFTAEPIDKTMIIFSFLELIVKLTRFCLSSFPATNHKINPHPHSVKKMLLIFFSVWLEVIAPGSNSLWPGLVSRHCITWFRCWMNWLAD